MTTERPRLLRPRVHCPKCHRYPPLRITAAEREAHAADPPQRLLATWQCSCGIIHEITAAAYRDAA